MRVQIPAYTDRWMMGDRFGDVVKVTRKYERHNGKHGHLVVKRTGDEVAHVRLDKSGKTVKVIFADCTVVNEGIERMEKQLGKLLGGL